MPGQPKGFFSLKTLDEVRELERTVFADVRTEVEPIPSIAALGRVLAEDVASPGPVPQRVFRG